MQVQELSAYQALSPLGQDYVQKQTENAKLEYKSDTFELSNSQKQEPITFKEGFGLYAKGFTSKVKSIFSAIIKHPIKTAGIILGTTALLGALPLIGISTVAAGSALALLYAGIAIGKTTYHTAKFIKNKNNENYDEARKNLGQMGSDTVDLALTLPFVPKAIKNVKDFVKFGKIGVNHELIEEINASEGVGAKFKALKNGNVKISEDINFKKATADFIKTPEDLAEFEAMRNLPKDEFTRQVYQKVTKQMGIEDIAPEMEMSDKMASNTLGGFDPCDCSIKYNQKAFQDMKQSEIINTVRHELEHYKQFSTIARYKGPDYMAELQVRSYVEKLKTGKSTGIDLGRKINEEYLKEHGEEALVQHLTEIQKAKQLNVEAYQKVIDKMGVIEEGTPEALEAQQYIEAQLKYPNTSFMIFGPTSEYLDNILEVNARQAGENPEGFIGEYKKASEAVDKLPPVQDTFVKDDVVAIIQGNSVAN